MQPPPRVSGLTTVLLAETKDPFPLSSSSSRPFSVNPDSRVMSPSIRVSMPLLGCVYGLESRLESLLQTGPRPAGIPTGRVTWSRCVCLRWLSPYVALTSLEAAVENKLVLKTRVFAYWTLGLKVHTTTADLQGTLLKLPTLNPFRVRNLPVTWVCRCIKRYINKILISNHKIIIY